MYHSRSQSESFEVNVIKSTFLYFKHFFDKAWLYFPGAYNLMFFFFFFSLAASGLSCGTWDLLLWRGGFSLVVACGL